MNVKFEDFNTEDVAKIFGVSRCTITGWCRNGYMRAQDVAEAGSQKPRYLITDAEVSRIQNLIKRYGTRKWMLYANTEKIDNEPKVKEEVIEIKEEEKVETVSTKKLDADKIAVKISQLRDLEDQISNAEAELNQMRDAAKLMREEIVNAI